MTKNSIAVIIVIVAFLRLLNGSGVHAQNLLPEFSLPYEAGQSFVVTQGYDSPPTHINKDEFAIDFSQNNCDAYGKPALATADGMVMLVANDGYNGGYGTEVLIDHGDNIVSRYAHMISGSIAVVQGSAVTRGTILGAIGDTGLVAGNACGEHPGTHVHFAVYEKMPDGSYYAVKPEPLSGYQHITEGQWYLAPSALPENINTVSASDASTSLDVTVNTAPSAVLSDASNESNASTGVVLGTNTSTNSGDGGGGAIASVIAPVSTSVSDSLMPSSGSGVPVGGVIVVSEGGAVSTGSDAFSTATSSDIDSNTISSNFSGGDTNSSTTDASGSGLSSISLAPPVPANGSSSLGIFDTTTLAIDLSWQTPQNTSGTVIYSIFDLGTSSASNGFSSASSMPIWIGTSTNFSYQSPPDGSTHEIAITATDAAGSSSTATTRVALPNWMTIVQSDDSTVSYPSWYQDTWNQLGTGFYGTIRSLTLNGYVDNPDYYYSHLSLDEFLDPAYTILNQSFDISDAAPFTATSTLVTMNGLNIELQPNKYYRLDTYNDYQNRSVILRGTSATGTAMSDGYEYGVGRVENDYSFYPYLAWTFIPDWPSLAAPNTPPDFALSFDPTNVALDLSWARATDPDTTSTLLTYEYAVTTSTSLDGATWQSVGKNFTAQVAVVYPNSYTALVRARDDLNNVSAPAVISWNFPAGYVPLPSQLNYDFIVGGSPEKFHLYATTTITSVGMWTVLGSGPYRVGYDSMGIYADENGTEGDLIASSTFAQDSWPREIWHDFPTPITLPSGDYWLAPYAGSANGCIYYGDANGDMYFQLETE